LGRGHPDHRPVPAASKQHYPISRYYTLEEFKELREYGASLGFKWVEANPLVRSSYHAAEQVRALSVVHRQLYGDAVMQTTVK